MPIRILDSQLRMLNAHLRMPFQYGIVTATASPHLLARIEVEIDGRRSHGLAADFLPPKWFTKDPATTYREDLADMLHVIETAFSFAQQLAPTQTVFRFWQDLHTQQMMWATNEGYPPLLWGFGVSLVERALIDAFCRATHTPFAQAVRENTLGIDLGEMHGELMDRQPRDFLPEQPLRSLIVRHTVALGDPLTEEDIMPDQRVDDGLPQSLEACIDRYDMTHFKIKLSGDKDRDAGRLARIAGILNDRCGDDYAFSLDGNENYREVEPFAVLWHELHTAERFRPFVEHLLFVEQPLHREVALSAEVEDAFADWEHPPPIIIDESDALLGSLPDALEVGYTGTSVKNCKGVFKGIANACLIEHLRREEPERTLVLSAEDLCNVAPVALMQDFASVASLGIGHVERNGHHFLRGLHHLPDTMRDLVLEAYGDLYERVGGDLATLRIRAGKVDVSRIVDAPSFGLAADVDLGPFTPVEQWRFDSLGIADDKVTG